MSAGERVTIGLVKVSMVNNFFEMTVMAQGRDFAHNWMLKDTLQASANSADGKPYSFFQKL